MPISSRFTRFLWWNFLSARHSLSEHGHPAYFRVSPRKNSCETSSSLSNRVRADDITQNMPGGDMLAAFRARRCACFFRPYTSKRRLEKETVIRLHSSAIAFVAIHFSSVCCFSKRSVSTAGRNSSSMTGLTKNAQTPFVFAFATTSL